MPAHSGRSRMQPYGKKEARRASRGLHVRVMSRATFNRYKGGLLFAGFVLLLFGLYFGYRWVLFEVMVGGKVFPPLSPKNVSLIGIRLAGERIIVSNGIAQLAVDEGGGFEQRQDQGEPVGAAGAKIPIGGLTAALQYKPEGLEELVMALNRIEQQILPDAEATWDAADIRRALDGDERLRLKLERDLNTTLEGQPSDLISKARTFSGIWIRLPMSARVPAPEGHRVVEFEVTLPFSTYLVQRVRAHPQVREKFDVDLRTLALVYEEVWGSMQDGTQLAPRKALADFIDASRVAGLVAPAEKLLSRVTVLLTDDQIKDASLKEFPTGDPDVKSYTINLELSREGRDRLWQYTRRNPRSQLLLVVEGVAIAAPVVQHEMMYYTAAISNIQEEDLAKNAVEVIRNAKKSTT